MWQRIKIIVDSIFTPARVGAAAVGGPPAAIAVKLSAVVITALVFIIALPAALLVKAVKSRNSGTGE